MADFDVIIVGAGLSGIGAACRLTMESPREHFAIFEARDAIGGTWDLFRYPGIRSDSDMYTLGYPFAPWTGGVSIAEGGAIKRYIEDTAREYGVTPHIRFRHKIVSASWSTSKACWTLDVEVGDARERRSYTCRFLFLCTGYYAYDQAHRPSFPHEDEFGGRFVHPQWWPEDLDYAGKRIVVIGSGATAITLVPSLAKTAAHVTMLQRSPTYILSLPQRDKVADRLRRVLPESLAHRIVRGKNVTQAMGFYQFCRRFPERAKRLLQAQVKHYLPEGYPLAPDFTPRYQPWDERLCVVPNHDLYDALGSGKAEIVTDTVARFTATGLRTTSGRDLEADIVVTATGLSLLAGGGIMVEVDGVRRAVRECIVYKGLMLADVPNLAWCVGYVNASWTLRADLTARYVCRLLNYLRKHGYTVATPHAESIGELRPIIDLAAGYVQRARNELPQQGSRRPWYLRQNYLLDRLDMALGKLDDGELRFSSS
jgi:cation diffusion facilitator CzcD-associated flavoprotein CzcO